MYEFTADSRYLFWTSTSLKGLANKSLTWQTTSQQNIGLDTKLFNNMLSAGVDIFYKSTNGLLSPIDISQVHGFSNYMANVGKTENYGYEATIGGYIIRNTTNGLLWHLRTQLAYTKNSIVELSEDMKRQSEKGRLSEYGIVLEEGKSQNSIYAVRSLGIDPATGEEVFLDKDGNVTKVWNAKDRVYCGEEQPPYIGSINSLLTYKKLSLNLSFGYHWGAVQYNQTLLDKVEIPISSWYAEIDMKNNVDKRVDSQRWQKPGDVTFYRKAQNEKTKASSRFVMDDNTFELQSASLQYRWDTKFVRNKLKAQAVNFTVNMSDIFYLSSIDRERGIQYPFANNMQFTMSVNF